MQALLEPTAAPQLRTAAPWQVRYAKLLIERATWQPGQATSVSAEMLAPTLSAAASARSTRQKHQLSVVRELANIQRQYMITTAWALDSEVFKAAFLQLCEWEMQQAQALTPGERPVL